MNRKRLYSRPKINTGMAMDSDNSKFEGVQFLVNSGGFPIDQETWLKMFKFAKKLAPDKRNEIDHLQSAPSLNNNSASSGLQEIAHLAAPTNHNSQEYILAVQNYMNKLQYNHIGTQFFLIKRGRPISGLMETAKEMIRESLPIKCLEAVILSIFLTMPARHIDRFTIGFKSVFMGNVYRHVVLGLHSTGQFGALGMSRRPELMYKEMTFSRLSDLIFDYKSSYEKYLHRLERVKIGLPIPHDQHNYRSIPWKGLTINFDKENLSDVRAKLDRFSKTIRMNGDASVHYNANSLRTRSRSVDVDPAASRQKSSESLLPSHLKFASSYNIKI